MARFLFPSTLLLALGLLATPAPAQVTPDGTVGTVVTPAGTTFTITGGTTSGTNLFHSFSQFSVPTGGTADFNNAANIANIFSRVTGTTVSNIDGLIQANDPANLFLLNPNGIIFGPNARLDIGGSFIGTTANSIQFADGVTFSATNATSAPLLSVNVPIGLQFGQNPGAIQVQGSGHTLAAGHPVLSPIGRGSSTSGLQVETGRTLALVGGNVSLEGGAIAANSGHIELGSVVGGVVRLTPADLGWQFSYEGAPNFGDIALSQRSLADASGFLGGGSIQVQGRTLSLNDGSVLLIQNVGEQASGAIDINARESVNIGGFLPDINIASGLVNEALGNGAGGDITIATRQLTLQDGGVIAARTFSEARGGNIIANVSESIEIIGFFFPDSSVRTAFILSAFEAGDAGTIQVSTERLNVINGGLLATSAFGTGNSGNIKIDATQSVQILGATPITNQSSLISGSTFNSGDAGRIAIETQQLRILDGGRISSATFASGAAGNITLNASELVEVSGKISGTEISSQVRSSADFLGNPVLQRIFQLPPVPDGLSGDVTINTSQLRVADGASLSVGNVGSNNAGDLRINANSVFLDRGGRITASTSSGKGGNLNFQLRDVLVMRRGSLISAEAGGTGDGGNIVLNSPIIIATDNSDIIANAFQGNGGNISITANGIFGTAFREELTPESDITASSQFGVNGIVAINNPDVDPSGNVAELPEDVTDPSNQIESGCAVAADNRFTVTGRGGLPPNPTELLRSTHIWSDVRDISEFRSSEVTGMEAGEERTSAVPVEATGWMVDEAGRVALVAAVPHGNVQANAINCTGTIQ